MEEKIINILKKCCEDFEDVMEYDGECMVEDGIIDSFTVLSLVDALEGEFDIIIPDNFFGKKSVGGKK